VIEVESKHSFAYITSARNRRVVAGLRPDQPQGLAGIVDRVVLRRAVSSALGGRIENLERVFGTGWVPHRPA
jgi:hypothetical protein